MKNTLILLVIFIVLTSCSSQQNSNKSNSLNSIGLDPNLKLVQKTFFNKMTFLVPQNYKSYGDLKAGKMLNIIGLENSDHSVWMKIRKKEGELMSAKMVHEQLATSYYNGEIHKSEFQLINNLNVYIFEMTGYWNESEIKESWLKFFVEDNGYLYQCLIKYPEKDRTKTEELRKKIVESLMLN